MITLRHLYPRAWLLFLLLLLPILAPADSGHGVGLKPDVRLLIDISGSMKQSDPDNLRAPALDLIVRLLPEGSRAGVWTFGEEVELLVPHRVIDEDWRRQAREAVSAIDNSGQRTNIPAAIEAATYDLKRMNPGYRTSIILLTDGKVDVSQSPMTNASASRAVLSEVAPELGATGIPVHTIALSDEADWVFLRSLAQGTAGLAEKAESPRELSAIFLQSLETVAPTARVPVANRTFRIDDSVREFTALVFYEGDGARLGLVSPDGERYRPANSPAGIDWFSNEQFALVTVREPKAGEWKLNAPHGSKIRVTVISNLQLEVDPLPNSMPAERHAEVGLRLMEDGSVLRDPEVLGLFSISLRITGPREETIVLDVSGQYPIPENGEYRVTVPPFQEPGRYRILARVRAGTLERELPMYVDITATPAKSTVVTRGEELPEDDLQMPLLSLGVIVLVLAVVIHLILRRRKRRKLELWARRSRDGRATGNSDLMEGLSAGSGGEANRD